MTEQIQAKVHRQGACRVAGIPSRYFDGVPIMGIVAGPGMAYCPCSYHDPGGVAAGLPGHPLTADRDTDEPVKVQFSL